MLEVKDIRKAAHASLLSSRIPVSVFEVLQVLVELGGMSRALDAHICVDVLLAIFLRLLDPLLDLVLVELVEYRVVVLRRFVVRVLGIVSPANLPLFLDLLLHLYLHLLVEAKFRPVLSLIEGLEAD